MYMQTSVARHLPARAGTYRSRYPRMNSISSSRTRLSSASGSHGAPPARKKTDFTPRFPATSGKQVNVLPSSGYQIKPGRNGSASPSGSNQQITRRSGSRGRPISASNAGAQAPGVRTNRSAS